MYSNNTSIHLLQIGTSLDSHFSCTATTYVGWENVLHMQYILKICILYSENLLPWYSSITPLIFYKAITVHKQCCLKQGIKAFIKLQAWTGC